MIGFIIALVVGGVAGYIAEQIMKADHPWWLNVILGVAGAFIVNIVLAVLGFWGGGNVIGQLIAGIVGACILIYAYREYERRR